VQRYDTPGTAPTGSKFRENATSQEVTVNDVRLSSLHDSDDAK
jgi:hypothetical protein